MFHAQSIVADVPYDIVLASSVTETTARIAMMWSAIVLLVVCPIAIVAIARTRRRVRELETAEKLAELGYAAADIARIIDSSKEPLGKRMSEEPPRDADSPPESDSTEA